MTFHEARWPSPVLPAPHVALFALLLLAPARGQAPVNRPSVQAARVTAQMQVDGVLDEPAWRLTAAATDFTQQEPEEGNPATQRTEVRFLFDAEALYVGARMYDSAGAAGVASRLFRRDGDFECDFLRIVFDTFHDHLGRTNGMLTLERRIPGGMPQSSWDVLVAEIQETVGFSGTVSGVGHTLTWHGTKPGFVGRDVRVTITGDRAETRLHIEEHIELRGASIFAPGWGAAGGALLSFLLLSLLGAQEAAVVFALPMAIGGAVLTAKWITGDVALKSWPELVTLADRLVGHIERHALPPGGRPTPG